jgi:hypothetical protein
MSYNGSGTFVINSAGTPYVTGTVISSTAANALNNDLANGLTTCITKDGQTTPTANIPLGGFKITNLGAGTVASDAARLSQVQNSGTTTLISITGTDTITGTVTPTLSAIYVTGQVFSFVVAATNTGAVTLNIDSQGAKAVTRTGAVALVAGDMVTGQVAVVEYDGTRFQLLNGNSFTNLKASGTLGVTGATTLSSTLGVTGATTLSSTLGVTGAATISVSSASDALRITQTGAGNALLVEDSANPDATPFVIDNNGFVAAGSSTTYVTGLAAQGRLAAMNNVANTGQGIQVIKYRASPSLGADVELAKSASSTIGTNTLVGATDTIGTIWFTAADGTSFIPAATIASAVDGTPGLNDMPGRLVFSTTADGASTPTERMRIGRDGTIGVGVVNNPERTLDIARDISGGTNSYGINQRGQVQTGVTGAAGFRNAAITSAFTLPSYIHYLSSQGTLSGTVTNQYGFNVESTLTGATNNYGFYSNIASGTGRWNFYANGTANNYMAGALGIGTTSLTGFNLRVAKALTGSTTSYNVLSDTTIQSDVTTAAYGFRSLPNTQAAVFTLSTLSHFSAGLNNLGAGSVITTQIGFRAELALTRATNNYGFYGDIASGTGRWNFYANGTASNYFAGDVLIGTTSLTGAKLHVTDSAAGDVVVIESTDAGALTANLSLFRNSASPAISDILFKVSFDGKDSGGNKTTYATIDAFLIDPTDTTEDAKLRFTTTTAGTQNTAAQLGAGLFVGAPSGTDKGAGTINATTLYADGALTLASGSITDTSGAISFGNENLTTTGTITATTMSITSAINFQNTSGQSINGNFTGDGWFAVAGNVPGTGATMYFYGAGASNANDLEFYVNGNKRFNWDESATTFRVEGTLSKSSGTFQIDHPLPSMKDTHDLVHSFIEGPKADLIYRGKVTLSNGTASVNIDEVSRMTEGTFVLLCRDIDAFVTNNTSFEPVIGSVTGNILTITSKDPNSVDVVSWLVIGERQDKHILEAGMTDADGHVITEPLKVLKTFIEKKQT